MTDSKLLDKLQVKLTKLNIREKKLRALLDKTDALTDAVLKYDNYDTRASKVAYVKWIRSVKELDKVI